MFFSVLSYGITQMQMKINIIIRIRIKILIGKKKYKEKTALKNSNNLIFKTMKFYKKTYLPNRKSFRWGTSRSMKLSPWDYVPYHVSHVMCHVLRVTCQILHTQKMDKAVKLVGGRSDINRTYPV